MNKSTRSVSKRTSSQQKKTKAAPAASKPSTKSSIKRKSSRETLYSKRSGKLLYEPSTEFQTRYRIGDYVLGRVYGYPWWVARIVTYRSMPDRAQRSLRVSKKRRGYYLEFLPSKENAFLDLENLRPLTLAECRNILDNKFLVSQKKTLTKVLHELETTPPIAEDELSDIDVELLTEVPKSYLEIEERYPVEKITYPSFSYEEQLKQPISTIDQYAAVAYSREKTILFYKIQLQKLLLRPAHRPTEEEIHTVDKVLSQLEQFRGLVPEFVQSTQLGRLLEQLVLLVDVPLDAELRIVERIKKLKDDLCDASIKKEI
ncbi:PWWP domain-containing protein [Schizosaccharomyces japonicus yFS275]|uniref:PWWP domain-containing protein n=1 Tax=Schizosaccharomyces japonicus (strain yFS275 / FY16936) TaxID=402676 RepID=B6JX84_SCHJY|nr:PWWP domain-containing protein [Schizosaccharomyces japonicus yFS275]EEB05985.1 PWWP domain-containing protein [Schizosaccharomyces japonicus yFS275]